MKSDDYKFVSVEGCKLVGQGKHGKIYQLNDEQIIKVYYDKSSLDIIEKEYELSKKAFILGVPTAITFGTVKTEMGYGIIYESAGIMPLGTYIENNPQDLEECAEKFADTLIALNSIEADTSVFGSVQNAYVDSIKSVSDKYLSQRDKDALVRIVKAIPAKTKFIHTDFHTQNVMIDKNKDILIIDMADVGYGNPIFDVGVTYTLMCKMPKTNKKTCIEVTGLSPKNCLKVWEIFSQKYFSTKDPGMIKNYEEICSFFSNIRMAVVLSFTIDLKEYEKRIISLIEKWGVVRHEERYIKMLGNVDFPSILQG